MKRITVFLLLLCLLLCGCAEEVPEITTAPTQQQTEAAEYIEPTGLYDPDSEIEALTGGAVRAYPLSAQACTGFAVMGTDVIVFAGTECTTIRKLSGGELYESAAAETALALSLADPSTQVTDKGVSYFDYESREMVLLDTSLREISRVKLPADLIGAPVMSADRKVMYYCTPDAIRAYDMEAGFSRLVKQIENPAQYIQGLLMEDTVLMLCVKDPDGLTVEQTLFVSAETGETLSQLDESIHVSTYGDGFFTVLQEGAMQAMVYGTENWQKMLLPAQVFPAQRWYLESRNAALIWWDTGSLEYYDLESGRMTATVTMEGMTPVAAAAAPEAQQVYLLCSTNEGIMLCLWDISMTPCTDETVYTGPRYTLEDPDTAGLEKCKELAQQIGQKHGIEVLIGTDAAAVQPWEYALEAEYQVPMILLELEKLDRLLDSYPESFLSTAAKGTESGVMRICLVRRITGTPESGYMAQMNGASFWVDENVYAAIAVGQTTDQSFYHTIFHVLETRIMSKSKYCYEWDKHNPEGFAYDYDYTANQSRQDHQYLEGENRAFIDMYSMSFPREDRATIMAYAMTEGNESLFEAEILQQKLLAICQGIRKAFGLEKSSEVYIWEQYLDEPLAKGK